VRNRQIERNVSEEEEIEGSEESEENEDDDDYEVPMLRETLSRRVKSTATF